MRIRNKTGIKQPGKVQFMRCFAGIFGDKRTKSGLISWISAIDLS